MDEYSLNRQDFDSINELTKFKSKGVWAADPTKELTTQVKTAFTKEANKSAQSRRIHSGFLIDTVSGKKRARKDLDKPREVVASMEVDEGVVEDVVDEIFEEDDEDDDENTVAQKKAKLLADGISIIEKPSKKGVTKRGESARGRGGRGRGR